MVIFFASMIFRVSIDGYRTAGANAEIMQKLRAITDQLSADFKSLQKDGYLLLHSDELYREEFANSPSSAYFRADRIYYFSTGDFQSWFDSNIRSNIARVYFGHDESSFDPNSVVSEWRLARDVMLLTPGNSSPPDDCNDVSFAECKVDLEDVLEDPNKVLSSGVEIDIGNDPNEVRRLMCQNAGEMRIEWTDGSIGIDGELEWWGLGNPIRDVNSTFANAIDESSGPPYEVEWNLGNSAYWPSALKFTFTLYDSKGILEGGRKFTHIVYLEE